MRVRSISLALFALLSLLFVIGAGAEDNKFKLKLGAKGKLCLNCHVTFEDKMKKPSVHTPVRTGECSGCHNPHTAAHGKLLAANVNAICSKCHPSMIPDTARSTHKVVVEGNCTKCHDPHASDNKFNLLKAGNELCFGCHGTMGESVKKARFKHAPVEKSCLGCHNPHASSKSPSLLAEEVPGLCLKCHKGDKPSFVKQHMNYPVTNARCTTCHDVHGSDKAGILYNTVHKPVANKMCNQCHNEATAQNPFAVKKAGYELCRTCHAPMVDEVFAKNRLHWPLVGTKGCLSCHNPHASKEAALVKGPLLKVCGSCHQDSVERQEKSVTKHLPIKDGQCTSCHSPHGSDVSYLLQKPVIDQCGACHDWQKHSTHPIGEKIIDPRNKNLTVLCLSCHRSHGTEYKNMLHFPTVSDLCTQCHVQFKR